MLMPKSIKTEHADIIHDVSFDHHGKRMATCSSDQTVKVWDQGKDGKWQCTASWRTHSGSVWRVTWAHPEFGQVLATCSYDRTVAVWEELSCKSSNIKGGSIGSNSWSNKASLVDSRTSVTDVRFGPKHLGLLLATCSADGIVRIYEAVDVMTLSSWQLQHEIAITINNINVSLSCLSWSTSRLHPQTIAVGSDDLNYPTDPKVFIYRFNDTTRKWELLESLSRVIEPVHDVQFAPHLGRSFHMLAVASRDLSIFSLRDGREDPENKHLAGFELRHLGTFDNHKGLVWRVSWSVFGNKLASTGNDGCALLWKANYQGQWQIVDTLKANNGMSEMERVSAMAVSMSSTPTSTQIRMTPPPGAMNIKRTSGWPYMDIDVDQGKMYY